MADTIYELTERENLHNRFIIGCRESIKKFTKTETEEIRILHKWFDYHNSEIGSNKFHKNKTESVEFLLIIDLSDLKEIINYFKIVYLNEHPFSEKSDFIESIFGYNIYMIKTFIEKNITFCGPMLDDEPYDFYYYRIDPTSDYIVYVLPKNISLDYFKQYYKQVLKLIDNIEYGNNSENKLVKQIPIDKEIFKNNFNEVAEETVQNYFNKNLVAKKLLTEEQLLQFLRMAFQEKKEPTTKLKFNKTQLTNEKIINLFYVFMKELSSSTHGKKKDYVNLLSGYFEGFPYDKVFNNFAKAYQRKAL